jgi:hypothetical protein
MGVESFTAEWTEFVHWPNEWVVFEWEKTEAFDESIIEPDGIALVFSTIDYFRGTHQREPCGVPAVLA